MAINLFRQVMEDRSGATALEYGFIVAFVSAVLLGGAIVLADSLGAMFGQIATKVADSVNSP